jgi:prephenate dehydrogenase
VLTPDLSTPRAALERLSAFLTALGASPFELDPDTHDHILAYTSHLPQLAASALMHVVGEAVGDSGLALSGGGLADTTRVAASPARIWTDICSTNADHILPALDSLIATLQDTRRHLTTGEGVDVLFESARRWRGRLKG